LAKSFSNNCTYLITYYHYLINFGS
jgi:hypothetical protein